MSEGAMTLTLSVEEAARLLGISRGLAYAAVARGELPTVRVGRRILVKRVALERMMGADAEGKEPEAAEAARARVARP